jgi:hypothetical protein
LIITSQSQGSVLDELVDTLPKHSVLDMCETAEVRETPELGLNLEDPGFPKVRARTDGTHWSRVPNHREDCGVELVDDRIDSCSVEELPAVFENRIYPSVTPDGMSGVAKVDCSTPLVLDCFELGLTGRQSS